MKRLSGVFLLVAFAIGTSGCYHANIITGQPESAKTVEEPWHTGWIYGLVYPEDLDVSEECPDDVARVETQLSFVNMLVSSITFGIYTPMTLEVTCAAGPSTSDARIIEGTDQRRVLEEAAVASRESGSPVYARVIAAK